MYCDYLFLMLSILLIWTSVAEAKRDDASQEFSNMAREIRVNRRVEDQLEYQTRVMEHAIKQLKLKPDEQRKLRSIMGRIEKMSEKTHKSGSMTPQEANRIHKEISRFYRTLWFMRFSKNDPNRKIVFFGQQIMLREPYQSKYVSGKLSQQEMADILRVYYSASRVREQMRVSDLSPKQKNKIKKECFTILSEYFTLAEPVSSQSVSDKRK